MNQVSERTSTWCIKCHKFFGSKDGMCSVCYKEEYKKMSFDDTKIENKDVIQEGTEKNEQIPEKPVQVISFFYIQSNKFNCWKCDKKVGYLGFKCKCNYIFCGPHRHFADHDCDYDFKKADREKFLNHDYTVENKKINKI